MSLGNYHKEYLRNEISTNNQSRLILMMYDGAIQSAGRALNCVKKKDIAGKGKNIQKCHDIVNELSLSLDLEKGGEVSQRLEHLYEFILRQLTLANIKSDPQPLESVISVLNTLNEAWEKILKNPGSNGPGANPPSTNITASC